MCHSFPLYFHLWGEMRPDANKVGIQWELLISMQRWDIHCQLTAYSYMYPLHAVCTLVS